MTFIRVQNAKKDENGNIIGGSASVVESVYQRDGTVPCRQELKLSLGKVVFMGDRRSGVFLTKDRGLVSYDVDTGEFETVDEDDPRVGTARPPARIRTLFGDCDAVMRIMHSEGILRILRNIAVKDDPFYGRMVCHTLHGVLRDGANICCDRFVERSFVSNIVPGPWTPLRTDTRYFERLGSFEVRVEFFKAFVKEMRLRIPGFGRGCYVDSTPLPNSITDLPSNRNCSHGVACTCVQTRLVLVLDIRTGYPVWFDLVPGNVLDLNTVMGVTERVSKLIDVTIDDMVLDAGYVCRDVISAYNLDDNPDKTLIARMPAKKGYGFEELFKGSLNLFQNAKYGFVRQDHTYFGIRREVEIFGKREYAYVYMDTENASSFFKGFLKDHADEYGEMTMKDKNWTRYRGGFFVLVSNIDTTPDRLLDRYYGRTEIETALNCGKEYLDMLPLDKHREETVNGKLMQDMMDLIVYLMIRKVTVPTGRSVSDWIYDLQALGCNRLEEGTLTVDAPNRQAKEAYALFGMKPPSSLSIPEYKREHLFEL